MIKFANHVEGSGFNDCLASALLSATNREETDTSPYIIPREELKITAKSILYAGQLLINDVDLTSAPRWCARRWIIEEYYRHLVMELRTIEIWEAPS